MTNLVQSRVEPPIDKAAFQGAVEKGIESANAGRLVSYDKVRAWLLSWGKPGEFPPPK